MIFVKIGTVEVILYRTLKIKFLQHFLPDWNNIGNGNVNKHLLSDRELRENRRRKGGTSVADINHIKFTARLYVRP